MSTPFSKLQNRFKKPPADIFYRCQSGAFYLLQNNCIIIGKELFNSFRSLWYMLPATAFHLPQGMERFSHILSYDNHSEVSYPLLS